MRSIRSARPQCAMLSEDSASISFSRTPRASTCRSRTSSMGTPEPWGTQVTAVEIKDIVLPDNMHRAMAQEAEAERESRAKIVAAEGEYQAAVKLGEAADIITEHPVALQLRTLQTMAEISVENNSTIIFPAQFMTTAGRKPSGGCRRIQHQNSLGVNPGAVAIQAAAIRDRDQARLLS